MKLTHILLTGAFLSGLCACTQEPEPAPEPVIEITGDAHLEAAPEGGPYSIGYTLQNETEDGTVKAEYPDWISEVDCSMHGTVSFTVAANDTEQQRSADLTIIYEYAEGKSVDASVSITQAGTTEAPPVEQYDYEYEMSYLTGGYYGAIGDGGEYNYCTWLSDLPFDSGGLTMVGGTYYLFDIYGPEPADYSLYSPAAGTYTLSDGTEEWTFNQTSSWGITIGESERTMDVHFTEGTLEITTDEHMNYAFEAFLTDDEGKTHHVTYSGSSPIWTDLSYHGPEYDYDIIEEDIDLEAENASAEYMIKYGETMEVALTFTDMEIGGDGSMQAPGTALIVDAYMPLDKDGNIAEGTYRIADNPGSDFSLWYGEIYELFDVMTPMGTYAVNYDGQGNPSYGLVETGTMDIKGSNGSYDIECTFTTFEGHTITCSYSGSLTVSGVPQGFSTLAGDYTLDLSRAVGSASCYNDYYRTGGNNWEIFLTPSDGISGDGFHADIVVESLDQADGIPSDTYTVSAAEVHMGIVSGAVNPGEYLKGYMTDNGLGGTIFTGGYDEMGYVSEYAPAIEGDLKITNHGDGSYTIEFDFADDIGNRWDGVWTGEIADAAPYHVSAPGKAAIGIAPGDGAFEQRLDKSRLALPEVRASESIRQKRW